MTLDTYHQNLYALCNGNQIKQVFLNLVKNAIEAIDNGGKIKIEARLENSWIEVSIADNGNGISAKLRDLLGQPFITTKESGTGLGLVICNKLIAEHKGTIDFESIEGKGTTFTIKLPHYKR